MKYFQLKNFFILLLLASPLFGLDFGIDAKRACNQPIERLQIFGERSSGTNYLFHLLRKNLKLANKEEWPFGHKHFMPWYFLPKECFVGPEHIYTLENSDDTLFVIVFRDPYEWLRSFHKEPHHGADHLFNISFSEFIHSEWHLTWLLNEDEEEKKDTTEELSRSRSNY